MDEQSASRTALATALMRARHTRLDPKPILHSRFAENALAVAASNGVRQYVMIGVGFGSFSLRRLPFAQDITA